MSKVMFSVRYSIVPEKRAEYLTIVKELKSIVKAEGLESYIVFEQKNKSNTFEEVYLWTNMESFENSEENLDERVDILTTKLSDLVIEKTTQYTTLVEVVE